jgi:hypothetical protein
LRSALRFYEYVGGFASPVFDKENSASRSMNLGKHFGKRISVKISMVDIGIRAGRLATSMDVRDIA